MFLVCSRGLRDPSLQTSPPLHLSPDSACFLHYLFAMEEKRIYHEKQRLQFCLLHALNNLLQEKDAFTRAELNAIADKLVPDDVNNDKWTLFSFIFKPHHNILTGNYDVNVLIAALEAKGKKVVWHDHRTGASSIKLGDDSLAGIMLNVPTRKFGGLWQSRHWVALRKIHGIWYDLDSDLKAGKPFQNDEHVLEYLDNIISQGGQVFIILHEKCSLCVT